MEWEWVSLPLPPWRPRAAAAPNGPLPPLPPLPPFPQRPSRGLAPRSQAERAERKDGEHGAFPRFTPDEDAYLREHAGSLSFREIAARLGRSRSGVLRRHAALSSGLVERVAAARAARLARAATARGRRKCRWTPREERFLIAWWGIRPDAWVARQLGRTVGGCEMRAWKVGVRRTDNHFSFEEALGVFGIVRNTLRRWIERGWVMASRAPLRTYRYRRWSIAEGSLQRLVTERSHLVDPARMRPGHYLTALAKEAHAREGWLTTAEAAERVHVRRGVLSKWLTRGYGPFVERPQHGGRGNVARLVRERDLPALVARAAAAAGDNYHEGALRREAGKAARRASGGGGADTRVGRAA
jgi:hypothetical protein